MLLLYLMKSLDLVVGPRTLACESDASGMGKPARCAAVALPEDDVS